MRRADGPSLAPFLDATDALGPSEATNTLTATGWQWPLPLWKSYSPKITDGWGSKRTALDGTPRVHCGVDLMYPRKSLDDQRAQYPVGTVGGSKWAFMPLGVVALAARAGRVTYAKRGPRGHAVTIKHENGWSTFYQHLASLLVSAGTPVAVGEALGEIGGDPTQRQALRHLHFELRDPRGAARDPKPHLLTWPRVELTAVDGRAATVLHPPPRNP